MELVNYEDFVKRCIDVFGEDYGEYQAEYLLEEIEPRKWRFV